MSSLTGLRCIYINDCYQYLIPNGIYLSDFESNYRCDYLILPDNNFHLLQGDTIELLPQFEHKFDMVFADPPYFLSNDGL